MKSFIQTTKDAGSKKFIIHARKALLKKLSPKENLNIPPLKYEFVYKLKEYFKNDEIVINGGIKTTEDIKNILRCGADKISINSEAIRNNKFISEAASIFGSQCVVVSIQAKKIEKDRKRYD